VNVAFLREQRQLQEIRHGGATCDGTTGKPESEGWFQNAVDETASADGVSDLRWRIAARGLPACGTAHNMEQLYRDITLN